MQIQSYPGVQATAWSAPGPLLRGHEPRAAKQLSDFAEGMAPVGAADKAALDAFFKGKRGERSLIEPVAEALCRAPNKCKHFDVTG